jgi:hypothetical protein
MPVLETTDRITPRSALRHRPIGNDGNGKGKPGATTGEAPVTPRASRRPSQAPNTQEEIIEWQRADGQGKPRAAQALPDKTGKATAAMHRPLAVSTSWRRGVSPRSHHQLVFLGLGMLLMVALWLILSSLINWFNVTMDDLHYGMPRTYQADVFVGHSETTGIPSHFIAINLHGHIDIIEFPGGDETHARVFLGPQLYGPGSDLVPATLRFLDLNGDHRLDMVILLHQPGWSPSSDLQQAVLLNDHGTFRPLLPSERPQIERLLQRGGS